MPAAARRGCNHFLYTGAWPRARRTGPAPADARTPTKT